MNYYLILFPFLCCIVLIIILGSKLSKQSKTLEKTVLEKHQIEVAKVNELKDYFKEEWNKQENELDNRIRLKREGIKNESIKLESDFQIQKNKLSHNLDALEIQLKEKEKRYVEVNQDLDVYREGKMNEIDAAAREYEQRKQLLVDNSVDKYRNIVIEQANKQVAAVSEEIERANTEIEKLKYELETQRQIRAAINEEILRQRAVEEQQDFYRIQLDPNDKDDVEILRSVAPRLRHPEAINKVIWTGYYQKPLAELRKRVGIEGSGVYKITRIKTGEIYIGQAVNVSTRWADHVKSALGVGTLASSQLHRAMQTDGCENFTFELLEETPKDKLRERESYYIDFYDSKNYGLNSVTGDKK